MTNTKLQKLKQLSRHKCDNPGKWGVPPLTTDYARFFCRNFAPEFMAPPQNISQKYIHEKIHVCTNTIDRWATRKKSKRPRPTVRPSNTKNNKLDYTNCLG